MEREGNGAYILCLKGLRAHFY